MSNPCGDVGLAYLESLFRKVNFRNDKEVLLRGDPGKIWGNAVAWDGPNN